MRPLSHPPFAALFGPLTAAFLLLSAGASPASAQPVIDLREELDRDRPEAWAMRWFAAALQPTGFGVATSTAPGRVGLSLELGTLPRLSAEQQTVGFAGTKREDLNRSPVTARLAATVGLPGSFAATLGWVPPVEVDGVTANFVSLRLDRPLLERESFRLGAALLGQTGRLEGDITCDARTVAAGSDPVGNPYRCEARSNDEQRLDLWGAELAFAYRLAAAPRWQLHVAAAAVQLDAEMRVDARFNGIIDRSVLAYDGWQETYLAGVGFDASERLRLAAEVAYAPLEVNRDPLGRGPSHDDSLVNVRLRLAWRLN